MTFPLATRSNHKTVRNQAIYAAWLSGATFARLAQDHGIHPVTVRDICKRAQRQQEDLNLCQSAGFALDEYFGPCELAALRRAGILEN